MASHFGAVKLSLGWFDLSDCIEIFGATLKMAQELKHQVQSA